MNIIKLWGDEDNMITRNKKNMIFVFLVSLLIIYSLSVISATNHTISPDDTGGIFQGIADTTDDNTLFLNNGIYNKTNEDTNITISKNITISGVGSPDRVIIDGMNVSRIFTIAINTNITFINLTFTNANTTESGGAIFNEFTSSTLTFINCIFINNIASDNGGAIYNYGDNLVVSGCDFINNTVEYDFGGAIYNLGDNLVVSGCDFINNAAGVGGAIYNLGDNSIVSGCGFINNTADLGGAINNRGDNLNMSASNFTDNTAESGGAINNDGGNLTVSDCNFINNIAESGDGGAIFNEGDNLNVFNCNFINNVAFWYGGAISNSEGNLLVSASNFVNNVVKSGGGGAIYNHGDDSIVSSCDFINNSAYEGGGAIYNLGEDLVVSGCNFINNTAGFGGAIFNAVNDLITQYNRFLNNSGADGFALVNGGEGIVITDFNWWGSNNEPSSLVSGDVVINNWIIVNVVPIILNGHVVDFSYTIKASDNSEKFNANLLPIFTGVADTSLGESVDFDARLSRTVSLINMVTGEARYTFRIDNQDFNFTGKYTKISTNSTIVVSNRVKVNEPTEIFGFLTDENGNILANTQITVNINGVIFNVLTDDSGRWNLTYIPNTPGIKSISVSWNGNATYLGFTNTTSFNVYGISDIEDEDADENDTETETDNDNSTANASMKNTGMPIMATLLVLLSLFSLYFRRKQ